MLSINDLKIGTYFEYNSEPYEVISSQHVKIGRGGAVCQTKIKNLITGNVISKNFKASDKFEEPEINKSKAQFLYSDNSGFFFMNQDDYEQFSLDQKMLGEKAQFLKDLL